MLLRTFAIVLLISSLVLCTRSTFADYRLYSTGDDLFPVDSLKFGTIQRDREHIPENSVWGHIFMQGGAGEGKQFLLPSGLISNKVEVKTDAILPAFCDPPNPCPPDMTANDGCLETFDNTAEFSRSYQANQDCLCDEDHMFSCPPHHYRATEQISDEINEFDDAVQKLLENSNIQGEHKGLVAKKFHSKRRVRRAIIAYPVGGQRVSPKDNPFLLGERLKVAAKKGKHVV